MPLSNGRSNRLPINDRSCLSKRASPDALHPERQSYSSSASEFCSLSNVPIEYIKSKVLSLPLSDSRFDRLPVSDKPVSSGHRLTLNIPTRKIMPPQRKSFLCFQRYPLRKHKNLGFFSLPLSVSRPNRLPRNDKRCLPVTGIA